jgi:cell division protein FtsL
MKTRLILLLLISLVKTAMANVLTQKFWRLVHNTHKHMWTEAIVKAN